MPSTIETIFEQFAQDDLIYWFVPIFIIAALLEAYYGSAKNLRLHERNDTKASLWMMLLTAIVDIAPKLAAFIVIFLLHEISPLRDVVGRQWWAWLLLLFLDELTYYWFHRLNHQIRILWAGHVSHHSAVRMHLVTALRQGVGERLHKYLFWLPLPLLGFDALMVFTMMSLNLFYQFWVHTELVKKLPPVFEWIFNTPSHHRVHHASNHRYLDRNHAGIFIFWDRLFGSFAAEHEGVAPRYGLTENLTSHHPLHVATHEYSAIWRDVKNAPNWQAALKYLFWAPGWRHDGPDKRAKHLRLELADEKPN